MNTAIQVFLLVLEHVLKYTGKEAVAGLGFGLISFTDVYKEKIKFEVSGTYSESEIKKELSTEYEVSPWCLLYFTLLCVTHMVDGYA